MAPSRSPRVQLEGLAKRASLRTIGDWIVLEYVFGEASLTSRLLRDITPSMSPRVQLEGFAKRASLRTIGDCIVLEYILGEASLTSLRWGKRVHTTPRYGYAKVHTPDWKNASCTAWKDEK